MSESRQPETKLLLLLLGVFLVFLLLRIPVFSVLMLRILLIGGIALVLYGMYRAVLATRRQLRRRAYGRSTEGRIQVRLEECRILLGKNEEEMADIRENIRDLEHKVQATVDIAPQNRRESQELLRAFRSELNLRQAKTDFYNSCIRKLEGMLHNHRLAREIEAKKQRLRELQENNYEELARLEAIRSELEMEAQYLSTIEELSSRMVRSTSIDDARHLHLELQTMTRELDNI